MGLSFVKGRPNLGWVLIVGTTVVYIVHELYILVINFSFFSLRTCCSFKDFPSQTPRPGKSRRSNNSLQVEWSCYSAGSQQRWEEGHREWQRQILWSICCRSRTMGAISQGALHLENNCQCLKVSICRWDKVGKGTGERLLLDSFFWYFCAFAAFEAVYKHQSVPRHWGDSEVYRALYIQEHE